MVWARLAGAAIKPGICAAYYEWPDDEGRVVVHLGFDIGDQPLADDHDVRVVELPSAEVASAIHRGGFDGIGDGFEAIVRWIDDNGHQIAGRSRELYLETDLDQPGRNVTELQVPITR